MKLSARSRYASRILLELARHNGNSPLSAAFLSQHTGVSVQFVEQILKPLKQHGLTKSVRGAAGGHRLAKTAEDITLGEVIRLMEGGISLTVCCGEKANDCPRKEGCLTRQAWMQVSSTLERELDSITISKLLHGGQVCLEGPQARLIVPKPISQPTQKLKRDAKAHVRIPRVITRKANPARRPA